MPPVTAYNWIAERGRHNRKKLISCKVAPKLYSDVETSLVPSLQFCMGGEDWALPTGCLPGHYSQLSLLGPPLHDRSVPSWGTRNSKLTGNLFVDYRRYGVRRLQDFQELKRSREASLSLCTRQFCREKILSHRVEDVQIRQL